MSGSYSRAAARRRSEWGRRMARARWRRERARREAGEFSRDIPFEEVVARARADRKGTLIAEGCSYSATAANHWLVRWSLAGRVDQLDLVFDSRVVFTGSRRRLLALAPWLRHSVEGVA